MMVKVQMFPLFKSGEGNKHTTHITFRHVLHQQGLLATELWHKYQALLKHQRHYLPSRSQFLARFSHNSFESHMQQGPAMQLFIKHLRGVGSTSRVKAPHTYSQHINMRGNIIPLKKICVTYNEQVWQSLCSLSRTQQVQGLRFLCSVLPEPLLRPYTDLNLTFPPESRTLPLRF